MAFERYWVGNGGKYDDVAHWAATSGGAGGASVPTTSDNITFDSNSFTLSDQVVTGPLTPVYPNGSEYYCANLTVAVGTLEFRMERFDSTALGDPGNALAVPTDGIGYGVICRVILNVSGNINLNSVTCHLGYLKITGAGVHTIAGVNNADFWDIDAGPNTTISLETGATLDVVRDIKFAGIFNFNAATINAFRLGAYSVGTYHTEIHDLSGTSVINIRGVEGVFYNGTWSGSTPVFSMTSYVGGTLPSEVVDLATTTINLIGGPSDGPIGGSRGSIEFILTSFSDPSADPKPIPTLQVGDVTISNCTQLRFHSTPALLSDDPTANNYGAVVYKSVSINVSEPMRIGIVGELHVANAEDLIITGTSETNTVTYYSQPTYAGGPVPQWNLNIDDGTFGFKNSNISYCTITDGTSVTTDGTCVNNGHNVGLPFPQSLSSDTPLACSNGYDDTNWVATYNANFVLLNDTLLKLSGLLDVDATDVADGKIFMYSAAAFKWIPVTPKDRLRSNGKYLKFL